MGSELGLRPDSKEEIVIDGVAIWWICWACIWTIVVAAGMAFLISKRHLPAVRIRGIGLSFAGIILLHLYWISCQLGVIYAPYYPDDLEFWIMGLYLPLGIGLFHAANYRFLYIAEKQKEHFADRPNSSASAASIGFRAEEEEREQEARGPKGWIALLKGKVKGLRYESKAILFVGIGMGVQIFLTIFIFCISRKYHSSWGIPGTEVHGTPMERKVQMGRGWEWWPSILWLFAWAWIAAPYMLWKSRKIRDTQGWRVQTIGSAVSILHAAPMWLIALYVPAMEKVNRFWIPPQWIAISIWLLEIFTIFLPCWEVLRQQTLKKETLEAIAQWEAKRENPQRTRSMHTASTAIESAKTGWKSHTSLKSASGESVYTMGALEYVLEKNPEPLQKFSALKDFSGENIAFLTSLAEWKTSLPKEDADVAEDVRKELVRERFNRALRIYTEFISSKDAEFQINLSSSQLKSLEAVFENSARVMCGDKGRINDLAAPFEAQQKWDVADTSLCSIKSSETAGGSSEKAMSQQTTRNNSCSDHAQFWGEVPEGYNEHVFDDAENAIKYLVLTNTWPKFVRNRRNSMISMDVLGEEGQIVLPAKTKDEQQS